MKQLTRTMVLAAALATLTAAPLRAEDVKAGDLLITEAWSRQTPAGAKVAGAYLTVENKGSSADRLVGGSTDIAGRIEIHEMAMDGGVMKMRALDAGLELPAGKAVQLAPGGYHVMMMDLKAALPKDSTVPLTLVFKDAKGVESKTELKVPVAANPPGGAAMPSSTAICSMPMPRRTRPGANCLCRLRKRCGYRRGVIPACCASRARLPILREAKG